MNQFKRKKILPVPKPVPETINRHKVDSSQALSESAVERKSKQISHLLDSPINDKEAAKFLGVATQTLRNWRSGCKGPAYLKLSPGPRGRVGYLIEDLQAYRDRCRIDPESR
jgi:hypothetical protein